MKKSDVSSLIRQLTNPDRPVRLSALRDLQQRVADGTLDPVPRGRDVNNHIHTQYSFSPYSPAKAVWMASRAGLATAGIMDHDTISGAEEFIEAGQIMKVPTTIGSECRVSFHETPLNGRRINNPDQKSVAYVAMHGIPHQEIEAVSRWFVPIRKARGRRNRLMTERLNQCLAPAGIELDYDRDILPLSYASEGGSVTERHMLFAAALQLIEHSGSGEQRVRFLEDTLAIPVRDQVRAHLTDDNNPFIAYDLLGVLKSDLVEKFYIDATDECPPVTDAARFAREHGIILAYAYLGDVTQSVTGDKKAQAFEDEYLEDLFEVLKDTGFHAVTYMPSRNTREQLAKVRDLCDQFGFFQISGEDINQPRQPFICKAMRDPLFSNLFDAAWALIGHERQATRDLQAGFFSEKTIQEHADLNERICYFRDKAMEAFEQET